jgi:hypothetical protein
MANGKSLSSFADLLAAGLLSEDTGGAAPRPEASTGACSDMG